MATISSSKMQSGPQDVPGPDNTLVVQPDTAPLKPGKYVFSLVVTDDAGMASAAATATVEVRAAPVVRTIKAPTVVAFNQNIQLAADVVTAGTITNFNWSVKVG